MAAATFAGQSKLYASSQLPDTGAGAGFGGAGATAGAGAGAGGFGCSTGATTATSFLGVSFTASAFCVDSMRLISIFRALFI